MIQHRSDNSGFNEGPADSTVVDLSIVVPSFNESENIRAFYDAVATAFDGFEGIYQIVFVDDGSRDDTFDRMREIADMPDAPCQITVVSFSRNFGKESAAFAGLEHARGEAVAFIDADLQQRPETLLAMYRELQSHHDVDVVAAYQTERKSSAIRNWFSSVFYSILAGSSGMEVLANASDFRVFRRSVADALLAMPEANRFSKGLFAWIGFRTLPYPYIPESRNAGETSWSFMKLVRYAISGLMSFSTFPLRSAMYLGVISSIAAFVYLLIVIIQRFFLGVEVPGYATIVVLILFFGSVQLLVLGSIGSYLGRVYIQGKHRPLYLSRCVIDKTRRN